MIIKVTASEATRLHSLLSNSNGKRWDSPEMLSAYSAVMTSLTYWIAGGVDTYANRYGRLVELTRALFGYDDLVENRAIVLRDVKAILDELVAAHAALQ